MKLSLIYTDISIYIYKNSEKYDFLLEAQMYLFS